MLNQLLVEETFQYSENLYEWRDAIRLAAKPLVENGSVTKNYVDRIIEIVEQNGPFIHLGKGIAIPHARPEDGVNKTSMSLLNLKNPTYLLNDSNHAISTIIVIASEDNEKHLKALKTLTNILTDDDKLNRLKKSTNFNEIVELIENY